MAWLGLARLVTARLGSAWPGLAWHGAVQRDMACLGLTFYEFAFPLLALGRPEIILEISSTTDASLYNVDKHHPHLRFMLLPAPQALGGADVILETSTSTDAANRVLPCLTKNGTFVILGVGRGAIQVDPGFMIGGRRKVLGFPSGTAADSEDALKASAPSSVTALEATLCSSHY